MVVNDYKGMVENGMEELSMKTRASETIAGNNGRPRDNRRDNE